MMASSDDLQRFVDAQEGAYGQALAEIRVGRKTSHWVWFIFPQLEGLGTSDMSRFYAIRSLNEAQSYLAHPLLGERLRDCVAALQDLPHNRAATVFGSTDAQKLHSSLTLFSEAAPGELIFTAALARWFGSTPDGATLKLLAVSASHTMPG